MALALTQVITEDRASGGQVIDGSLKFNSGSSHYLSRTPGSAGNRRTWTWSAWFKRTDVNPSTGNFTLFTAQQPSGSGQDGLVIDADGSFYILFYSSDPGGSNVFYYRSNMLLRDPSAWYHIVFVLDTTQAAVNDRCNVWINNTKVVDINTANRSALSQNFEAAINNTGSHTMGVSVSASDYGDGLLSQVYLVDGSALEPSYFGFTDPLTNTWRPKKYTGTYGTNGFYLPMDGNSPIGEDKSGRGNNWTPVNFGGSNTIEKATGALPILNTDGGGKVARVGVRTDSNASSLVLALPLVGIKSDFSNAINSGTSNKTVTLQGPPTAESDQSNFYGGSFLSNADGEYFQLSSNADFAMGTGDFCVECWIRTSSYSNAEGGYSARIFDSNVGQLGMYILSDGSGTIGAIVAGSDHRGNGKPKLNDWTHVAVTRSGSTVRIFLDGVLDSSFTNSGSVASSGDFLIGRRNGSSGSYLGYIQDFRVYKGVAKYTSNFIPASTNPDILPDTPSGVAGGSALTKITDGAVSFDGSGDYLSLASTSDFGFGTGDFTIECFVYYNGTGVSYDYIFDFRVSGDGTELRPALYPVSNGGTLEYYLNGASRLNAGVFSGNKWYHIAVVRNSSTTTLYVDGTSVGSFSDTNNYADAPLVIGQRQGYTSQSWNGFISNFRVIKGTALYTSNFTPPSAPLTNVTNTKLLCAQSNTSATAAAVTPGSITANGNAAATNFNPFTTDIDAVRGQESGYCTLNPLNYASASSNPPYDGNLAARVIPNTTGFSGSTGTIAVSSGKWYYEITVTAASGIHGIVGSDWTNNQNSALWWNNARGYGIYGVTGNKFNNGSNSSYGSAFSNGDIVQVAFDLDNGKIWFGKNNTWQASGDPVAGTNAAFTGLTGEFVPVGYAQAANAGDNTPAYFNFGQKPFKYAPPEGFKTLCLANLPRPTEAAVRPDKYFTTTLWSGDNVDGRVIDCGIQPDLIWVKTRNQTNWHWLTDSVRGAPNKLYSNDTSAEDTAPIYGQADSFTSTGWIAGGGTDGTNPLSDCNQTGTNYVCWAWKAGGAAVSNTDGSITSQVSANRDSGFSIVTYTGTNTSGQSVGHGLGVVPAMVITKRRNGTGEWMVKHQSLATNLNLILNQTSATYNTALGNGGGIADLTSSTTFGFVTGAEDPSNANPAGTMVAYCWSEVAGYSRFGSYTGNGSTDGPFVFCGFRPRWIMIKRTDSSSGADWGIHDSSRSATNPTVEHLNANVSDAEGIFPSTYNDFLSNGFKIRGTDAYHNFSGGTYIFAAFAEAPTQNLFGGQANAR